MCSSKLVLDAHTKERYQRLITSLLLLVGVLAGGLALSPLLHKPATKAPSVTEQQPPTATPPTPEAIARYNVAPGLPKYISVPSINVAQARIIGLSTTKNNKIIAPSNLHDAGWYESSAKPDQDGALFIYGHVSSKQARGLFYNLHKLALGDIITITRGDDTTFVYKVIDRATYGADSVPMDKVLTPANPSQRGLSLMTCAGELNKQTNEFSERLVIYASQVTN